MTGVLNIAKPGGVTSHDVVAAVRRKLGMKRVGHAGTLDPMATGVLVVAVGPATRFLQYMSLEPKAYRATICFGTETDSYDAMGEVVARTAVPDDLHTRVEAALAGLRGQITQVPPMFSAVKVNGKALYRYARQGQEVERAERTIYVERFETTGWDGPTAVAEVVCSGGTYVRSLAQDLGQAVGCGAHLAALHRTKVGPYEDGSAVALEDICASGLVGLADALKPMPQVLLDEAQVTLIRHGRPVACPSVPESRFVTLLDHEGAVVGVARTESNRLLPECVLPIEAALAPVH